MERHVSDPAERVSLAQQSATVRSLRRAEVLLQRRRAATLRRRRGFGLRLPAELPIILRGGDRPRLR